MSATISTASFQDMVARVAKGASNNKLMPITSMVCIQLNSSILTLTTTDGINHLKVIKNGVEGDDFYAVVNESLFSKLIAKMTSENIKISVDENKLTVKGNGKYNLALEMDENGVVKFPEIEFIKVGRPEAIKLSDIKEILKVNKAAVCRSFETPYLCGYYTENNTISTNSDVICFNDVKLFHKPALISPEMMNLLSLNTAEDIKCYRSKETFLFETEDVVIYGEELPGRNLFPVDEITPFLTSEFNSMCTLSKAALQNVTDRLLLFIEQYDNNGAYFTFTEDGITVQSKKSSSTEFIEYRSSENFTPFMCCVDVPLLREQIDANPSDCIELWYGQEAAIKLTTSGVTQVIALLEDEMIGDANDSAN